MLFSPNCHVLQYFYTALKHIIQSGSTWSQYLNLSIKNGGHIYQCQERFWLFSSENWRSQDLSIEFHGETDFKVLLHFENCFRNHLHRSTTFYWHKHCCHANLKSLIMWYVKENFLKQLEPILPCISYECHLEFLKLVLL